MSYDKLRRFIMYLRWTQEQDLDCTIITSGFKGLGKSTFGIVSTQEYLDTFGQTCQDCKHEWVYTKKALNKSNLNENKKLILKQPCLKCNSSNVKQGSKINFEKHLGWDNEDVQEKIRTIEPYSPIIPDEAVRFMMGEDWNKTESKDMKKLWAQMRTKHLIIFSNIPAFKWVDGKYRNIMTTFWIRLVVRGLAVMMIPDMGENDDPWGLDNFTKLLGNYNYFTPREVLLQRLDRLVNKHPSAFDYFLIPKVPDNVYAKYLEARDAHAFNKQNEDEGVGKKDYGKLACYVLMKRWSDLVNKVDKLKHKKPNAELISQFVFNHPTRGSVIGKQSVYNWASEVEDLFIKKKELELENKREGGLSLPH